MKTATLGVNGLYVLTNTDMLKIKNMKVDGFKVEVVPIVYYKNTSLERAIDRLFVEVDRAYREGVNILILSDRGVDENHMPIPSLLAVSSDLKFKYTILLRCSVTVPAPSTHIWHRIPSRS